MASGSKVPLIAVACACLLIVIAATIYYSSRSPKSAAKTEESETAASASVFPSDPSQDRPAPAPPTTHKAAAQQKISPNPGRDLSSAAVSGPVNAVPVHNPEAAKTAAMTTAKAAPETDTGASSAPPAPLPDRETNPIAAKSPALPTDSPALGSEVQAINVTGRASSPLAENIDPEITTQNRTLTALPASVPLSAGKPAPNSQSVAPASAVSRALIPAVPISQISPVYPELAIQSHTYGSVVLDVRINEEGKVVKATPVSGPTVLYSAAVKAVMQWRYKPASIGGKNVSSQTRVTMVFKP
jgi:TonB family protein